MTTPNFIVVVAGEGLGEGAQLDVLSSADLTVGANLEIRFRDRQTRYGRVIELKEHGARAVIEVAGGRYWLHRRVAVNVGGMDRRAWTIGGDGD